MSELPKSWVDCQLEEILLALESGSRPKGGVRNINEGIPRKVLDNILLQEF